jgi:hypothetical protein
VTPLRLILASTLVFGACGGKDVPAAPRPFRPAQVEAPPDPGPSRRPAEPTDCAPPRPLDAEPALTYGQRSIPEAEGLAREGIAALKAAEQPNVDRATYEESLDEAVDALIKALRADPYNVNATYSLARAYARIDRPQCSINLLQRLVQMRSHPSKRKQVEEKLDELLGRNRQPLDGAFRDLRDDSRFRDLIAGICSGNDDPGCVYGR